MVLFANPSKSSNRRFLQTPKKRQIGGVLAIFHILGTKIHRKYRCFWLRANAKPRYLRGFEPLLAKNHGIYSVLWPGPSKNTGIYAVSCMLSEAFFGCQRHKNIVNYTIFTRGQYQKIMKNWPKIDQKTPNKDLQNASSNFTIFFPTPNPQKRENPSRLKDFRGGSAAGARPRVAKAMLSCHHYAGKSRPVSSSWCCCCCWPMLALFGRSFAPVLALGWPM